MNPLALLGGWLWPAIGAAALAMLLAIGIQTKRVSWAKAETAEVKTAWAADRARAAEVARKAEADARTEEQRRVAAHKEITDALEAQLTQVRADAVIAAAASGRLQQRVAALVAAARQGAGNTPSAQGGAPADDAAGVLANLQRLADERAGILARIADERGAAGRACELAYEALTQ